MSFAIVNNLPTLNIRAADLGISPNETTTTKKILKIVRMGPLV